jgi:galactose mutarotase-like enzyme
MAAQSSEYSAWQCIVGPLIHLDSSQSYEIRAEGISATIIAQGACLTGLSVKDRDGKVRDVVVGFDDLAKYASERSFNGAAIG